MASGRLNIILLVLSLLAASVHAASVPSSAHLIPANLGFNTTSAPGPDHDLQIPPRTFTTGSLLNTRPNIRIQTNFYSSWSFETPVIPLVLLDPCILDAFRTVIIHRPTDPVKPFLTDRHSNRPQGNLPGGTLWFQALKLRFDPVPISSAAHGALSTRRTVDYEEFEQWVGHLITYENKFLMVGGLSMDVVRLEGRTRTLIAKAEILGAV